MAFFIIDFLSFGKYNELAGTISAIYISILGLYAGTKEYERWRGRHFSRYLGEFFTLFWTALIIIFILIILLTENNYRLPSEFVTVYISVLGVFALTQQSKNWHKKERQRK